MKIVANGIHIEVEDSGAGLNQRGVERPVVLLIMGLGMQLVAWPMAFVQALVDAGYRVVRFDNRDIGLSQHFDHLGVPNILWAGVKARLGAAVHFDYSLSDMAQDALGVLDALTVPRAHLVGVSMGGMIAQRIALAAPGRVSSLASIMSTSGARGLPQAKAPVVRALMSRPANMTPHAIGDFYVQLLKVIGSPGFPVPEVEIRERANLAFKRNYHPQGVLRQMMAIMADAKRAAELGKISVPTLVVHGTDDVLVPFACGEDTARRIPKSRFVAVKGMGHDLPPGVQQHLLANLLPHFDAA